MPPSVCGVVLRHYFSTLSIFLKPIAVSFGWSRGQLSAVALLAMLSSALAVPLIGKMIGIMWHCGYAWKKRRDRALQCVMLGGGLKVSEVSPDIEIDGSLKVSLLPDDKHETSYRHETFIQPEFVSDVLSWIKERAMVGVGGTLLFPGTDGEKLDKSSVYTQVKKTFTRAEIAISRVGGRTLRNTFAIKEIQAGEQLGTLQKKLGLADQRSVFLYKSINKNLIAAGKKRER